MMAIKDRKEALRRALAGESHAKIARDYGVTRQAIHALAKRGINQMGRPPLVDASTVTRIRDLRAQGLTWAEVGAEVGISAAHARKKAR